MPPGSRSNVFENLHLDLDLPTASTIDHTQKRTVATAAHNYFKAFVAFQGSLPVPPEPRPVLSPYGMLGTGFQQDRRGI